MQTTGTLEIYSEWVKRFSGYIYDLTKAFWIDSSKKFIMILTTWIYLGGVINRGQKAIQGTVIMK